MATLKDTAATGALNEDKYINKLYDTARDSQKQQLDRNYADNSGFLDSQQQGVQRQTDENLQRTDVEAAKAASEYQSGQFPRLSGGAAAQAGLSQWNQKTADTNALKNKQNEADLEIQRQRQLLASQYSAAIRQAQADNDMERAQQLYDAAKAEEAQLLEYRKSAASLMAGVKDNSILEELASGQLPQRDTESETWPEVLKNEEALNRIYDSMMESQRAGMDADYRKAISDLEAARAQQQTQTDRALTETYVDALQKAKNYAEVQSAYGQGSGTAAQARIARDMGLQENLTDLRGVQADALLKNGLSQYDTATAYRDAIAKANADIELKRAQGLFSAADQEEQNLVDLQQFIGGEYAKQGDYTILGLLYGLTPDQISRLSGGSGGGGGGYYRRRVGSPEEDSESEAGQRVLIRTDRKSDVEWGLEEELSAILARDRQREADRKASAAALEARKGATGGGSSVHTCSYGHIHGGGGGKY